MITIFSEIHKDLSVYLGWNEIMHLAESQFLAGALYSKNFGGYKSTGINIFLELEHSLLETNFCYSQNVDGKRYDVISMSGNAFQELKDSRYVSGWYDVPGIAKLNKLGSPKEKSLRLNIPQISIIETGLLNETNKLFYEKISNFSVKR